MEKMSCPVCGQKFANTQGLSGHMRMKHSEEEIESAEAVKETEQAVKEQEQTGLTKASGRTPASKAGSLDNAIEKLMVPVVPEAYNGMAMAYWEGFNKGVSYGANTILVGIRSAQELSSLGISQATPLIKMAQEMRQAEGQAAQVIAAEMAGAVMQGNQQLMGAINNLAQSSQSKPEDSKNPMMEVVADSMKPYLQQIMEKLMGGMLGGLQPKMPAGQAPADSPQNQTAQGQSQGGAATDGERDRWGSLPDNVQAINEEDLTDV